MLSAVAQALKSLGLTLPASDTGNSASSSTGPAAVSTASGASNVKLDLQQFMHQLFEAIKSQSTASPSAGTNASSSGDAQASFASGLSSLISAVSNGTAPAALQSAFAQLSVDLQPTSATGSSSSSSGSSSQEATLKAFLTNLQQDLGYGTSNSSLSGNLLTAQV